MTEANTDSPDPAADPNEAAAPTASAPPMMDDFAAMAAREALGESGAAAESPSASSTAAAPSPAASTKTDFCARCGTDIDPALAAFSGDGLVCKACENVEYMRDRRPGFGAQWFSGHGALGWGAISLVCNPFFICSYMAVTTGWAELKEARSYKAHGQTPPDPSMATKAVIGMLLGAFYPVILIGSLGLFLVMAALGSALAPEPSYDPYAYGSGSYDPYAYDSPTYDPPAYDPPSRSYDPPPRPERPTRSFGVGGLGTTPAAEPTSNRVELSADRPIRAQLAQHARRARALGLTPYVYAHADWCGPCRAIERYEGDPRMEEAFSGVYLIGADVDAIDDASLGQVGIHIRGIPAWYGIDARGAHDERSITGAAWGADVPSNMAPALGAFFRNGESP